MYKDIAELVYTSKTTDKNGFDVDSTQTYEIYASVSSVKRIEFYAAMQAGMKPSVSISTRIEDYEQTKHIVNGKAVYAQSIKYDGAMYNIIRTFQKNDSEIELTCE